MSLFPRDRYSADKSEPLLSRLSYRVGFLKGLGFPWFRRDIELHEEAIAELAELRRKKARAA